MPILSPGEQMIREEPVTMVRRGRTESRGKLLLTSRRVIYEVQQRGGFLQAPTTNTLLNESLEHVLNVGESKPLIPIPFVTKNILRVEFGDGPADFAVRDPTVWRGNMIQAKQAFEAGGQRREDVAFQRELALRAAGASQISLGGSYAPPNAPPPPAVAPWGAPQGGGTGMKGCIMCGRDIPAMARFCPHCKQPQG